MGAAYIENTLKKIFSGKGSARADDDSTRQEQLDRDWEKAQGKKKQVKKKKKMVKKKKKKWYSRG